MKRASGWLFAALVPVVLGSACDPIKGTPRQGPPTSACSEQSCEAYKAERIAATCNEGRCEFAERPDFPFTFVIDVPSTALYGAGQTFLIAGSSLYEHTAASVCPIASCLPLLDVIDVTGDYQVDANVGLALGVSMGPGSTAFPVQTVFVPRFDGQDARQRGLPVGPLFAVSRLVQNDPDTAPSLRYQRPLPAGSYLHYSYPLPPFDEILPPATEVVRLSRSTPTAGVGVSALDDPEGERQTAKIGRAEGLGGFRAWLVDSPSGARISSLRTLSGTQSVVRLDTFRQAIATPDGVSTALPETVDVVVAPPEGALALPTLESSLLSGIGLDIDYPRLPAPVSVTGVVGTTGDDGGAVEPGLVTSVPGRVFFTSRSIRDVEDHAQTILHYSTSVFTDDDGRFSTVLPPGVYDVTIEPAEGTGFGKVTRVLDVTENTAPTFEPPRRTLTKGRAMLSDGRPLGQAEVVANPAKTAASPTATVLSPRAARTRTADDGSFQFELDQGTYEIGVQPQSNTGFPRMVTIRSIGGSDQDLQTLEVPVPTRMSFALRGGDNGVPIVRATVRILAQPEGGGPAVEVASAMTDEEGQCEILLARQPR